MKAAVLSLALLCALLLGAPEDAGAFEASGGYCLDAAVNYGRVKRAEPLLADELDELGRQRREAAAA